MKILVTSTPDLRRINPQRPQHLLSYLSQNHDITALCVNARWLGENYDSYADKLLKDVKLSYITQKKINPVLQEFSIIKKLKELTGFDVHVNFNSLIAGYFVAKRLKARGIATVFDICDDLPQRIRISPRIPYLLRPQGKLVGRFMLRKNIKLAKSITYITRTLSDSYHFPPSKSTLIPNGVDTNLFKNRSSTALRQELGIDKYFVVGFVGILSEWVELEPALVAVSRLKEKEPNVKMLVVGGGDGLTRVKELACKYKISDKVFLTNHIPYTQVPDYISCMNCCLISLKVSADCQNAFPLSLLEYMACEKPVISTSLAGVKEAVGDRVLYASNAEEIKQGILELYHNEGLRRKMGHEGRAFIEQNYSWHKTCRQFEDVVLEAAARLCKI